MTASEIMSCVSESIASGRTHKLTVWGSAQSCQDQEIIIKSFLTCLYRTTVNLRPQVRKPIHCTFSQPIVQSDPSLPLVEHLACLSFIG